MSSAKAQAPAQVIDDFTPQNRPWCTRCGAGRIKPQCVATDEHRDQCRKELAAKARSCLIGWLSSLKSDYDRAEFYDLAIKRSGLDYVERLRASVDRARQRLAA